jgi:hypothetical protein
VSDILKIVAYRKPRLYAVHRITVTAHAAKKISNNSRLKRAKVTDTAREYKPSGHYLDPSGDAEIVSPGT